MTNEEPKPSILRINWHVNEGIITNTYAMGGHLSGKERWEPGEREAIVYPDGTIRCEYTGGRFVPVEDDEQQADPDA